MFEFQQAPPLSLYVHIPWCVRKCPYCDFNSHEHRGAIPGREYVAALLRDLDQALAAVAGRSLRSIFIGGGTPSLLPPGCVAELLEGIARRVSLDQSIEITLEANPGTVETGRFRAFRGAGVNRLSLGIQSFNDPHLKALGRIHDSKAARYAIASAQAAGFQAINLDLMFGLPDQTVAQALADLETAIACQPDHLSWYQLTIEPNTVFYKRPPTLPDDDRLWIMQKRGQALLKAHGYRQYEISAYARPGQRCAHNLNYWCFGDYLGIGAGAHSKLTDAGGGFIQRQARHRLPAAYTERAGSSDAITGIRALNCDDAIFEFMLNSLRLHDGVPVSLFQQRAGLPPVLIDNRLRQARRHGLLRNDPRRLHPTARGRRYLNDLVALFLRDDSRTSAGA